MTSMIRVSAQSVTTAVAGAIAGVVRDHGRADVQAIGASAVNQAVKAIAIAHGYLEEDELSVYAIPSFVEVDIGGQERTAIRFAVEILPPEAGGLGSWRPGLVHDPDADGDREIVDDDAPTQDADDGF